MDEPSVQLFVVKDCLRSSDHTRHTLLVTSSKSDCGDGDCGCAVVMVVVVVGCDGGGWWDDGVGLMVVVVVGCDVGGL